METIQPNENITLTELQERVKYILGFKSKLEKLLDDDTQQAVKIATLLRKFININSEDKELSKVKYDSLMANNKYLLNYRAFIEEFRQFSGRITKKNLHSFIFEITSAHSSTELGVLFPTNDEISF